jgi:hypothetical protein
MSELVTRPSFQKKSTGYHIQFSKNELVNRTVISLDCGSFNLYSPLLIPAFWKIFEVVYIYYGRLQKDNSIREDR